MNIEQSECDRLGYEYVSVLEQIAYLCHHAPFIKDYITEEAMKKFDDLCLKIATGDCEIIEFKRTLCRYNFTDVLKEKDDEINQLQSNWNSLREIIEDEKTRLATECSHTYEDSLGKIKYVNEDIFNELDKILDKINELEGNTNETDNM